LIVSNKSKTTTLQASELQTKRTAILKLIQKFRNHQPVYMPGLITHLNSIQWKEAGGDLQSPETMQLWLPSAIKDRQIRSKICPESLCAIEAELCFAQLVEALANLRRQLRQRVYMAKLKTKNGNGQAYWLKSNTFLAQVEGRIRVFSAQYNAARTALLILRGEGTWSETYRELKPEDIRSISQNAATRQEAAELKWTRGLAGLSEDPEDSELDNMMDEDIVPSAANPRAALGEGHRTLSWIWYTVTTGELGEDNKSVEMSKYLTIRCGQSVKDLPASRLTH
jgi:hypothetical protein